jgi:hypothetical protein
LAGRKRVEAEESAGNDRKLTPAVEETLGTLQLAPEDAAVARLALSYARTIDQAAAIAALAAKLPFDPDTAEAVEQLRKRVSAQATMGDLGPKLLAALDALGATPKARASAGKTPPAGAAVSKLAALRGGAA